MRVQHPLKHLKFLVGRKPPKASSASSSRSKSLGELQLPGGSWTPEDGAHPVRDPSVLLKTAVRTVKEATGLDLAGCLQWVRFLEVSYQKPAADVAKAGTSSSSASASAALAGPESGLVTERVLVLLADAWSVAQPNRAAYEAVEKAKVGGLERAWALPGARRHRWGGA